MNADVGRKNVWSLPEEFVYTKAEVSWCASLVSVLTLLANASCLRVSPNPAGHVNTAVGECRMTEQGLRPSPPQSEVVSSFLLQRFDSVLLFLSLFFFLKCSFCPNTVR